MLILGGVGRLYGAFIGVPLYMIAQDRFSELEPVYWYFWIGLLMVIVVLFAPRRRARPPRPAAAVTPQARDEPGAGDPQPLQELRRAARWRTRSISGSNAARAMR